MRAARLVVHGELIDHITVERATGAFDVEFELPVGLRDLVQSCGIPHVEVGRVTVNDVLGGWDRRLDDGDRIEAWPTYPVVEPERDARFVLDVHLGKLARLLRLLGFDTDYQAEADDRHLAQTAATDDRILLTRDRGLLMRGVVPRGRWIRATDAELQASEVLWAFRLGRRLAPFTRCMACGGVLEPDRPVEGEAPDRVLELHSEFHRCAGCGRLYWAGSHHDRLEETIDRIVAGIPG